MPEEKKKDIEVKLDEKDVKEVEVEKNPLEKLQEETKAEPVTEEPVKEEVIKEEKKVVIIVLSLKPRINYNPNIADFILPVIGIIALGAFVYFSILLIIDQDFKKLSMKFITRYITKNT
mgnify:CR=1 FL=1